MSANTSNRGYTYPQSTDHDRLWEWFQELATDIDADVESFVGRPRFNGSLAGTITNNSATALTPTANVNVGSMWSSGTDITVPAGEDGEYEMGVVLRFASQATVVGYRQCRVNVNGAEFMQWNLPPTTALNSTNATVSGTIRAVLAAGDDVSFSAFQNSGASLALTGNCRCWVEKLIQ